MLHRFGVLAALVCPFVFAQTITLTSSSSTVTLGQSVVLTATKAGIGSVVFTDNGRWLGSAPLSGGQAVLVSRLPAPGSHSIRAVFNGESSSVTVNVEADLPASFKLESSDANSYWHDLNGDGLLDRLEIGGFPFALRTQLNVGNGTFGPIAQAPTTDDLTRWTVADLDSDGHLDLLYLASASQFKLLRGKGNALFEAPETLPLPISSLVFVESLQAADMNGDGRADLVMIYDKEISIWLQTSPKAFVKHTTLKMNPFYPGRMLWGDFNGDKRLDIMTVDQGSSKQCETFLSSGQQWVRGQIIETCGAAVLADFNNDGRDDLISMEIPVGLGGRFAALRLANQSGKFGPAESATVVQTTPDGVAEFLDARIAIDWNKDGNLDLVMTRSLQTAEGGGFFEIRLGSGNGTFRTPGLEIPVNHRWFSSGDYQMIDLNGDDLPDIAGIGTSLIGTPALTPVIGKLASSQTGWVGTNEVREIAFNGTDENGGNDISKAYLLVGSDPSGANSCLMEIDRNTNSVRLQDDTGTNWSAPAVVGSAFYLTRSNSICEVVISGTNPLVRVDDVNFHVSTTLKFTAAFAGDRDIHARVIDKAGKDSGLKHIGGVFIKPPPKPVPFPGGGPFPSFPNETTTASITGTTQGLQTIFQLTITDPDGRYDIGYFTFSLGSLETHKGCVITLNPLTASWGLLYDDGIFVHTPDANGLMANSQCSVDTKEASITYFDKSVRVTIPVTFAASFLGPYSMRLSLPPGPAGVYLGTWGASVDPSVLSIVPTSGAGSSGTFTGKFSVLEGAPELYLAYMLFLPTPNVVQYTAKGSCLVEYNRISHGVRLVNDAGTDWLGPLSGVVIRPGAQTLSNGVCSVNVASISATRTGNTWTVVAPVTFKAKMQGVLGTFLQAFDVKGRYSGMTQFGNWIAFPRTVPAIGPAIDSVSQTDMTGKNTAVKIAASHSSGASSLAMIHLLAGSTIMDTAPCQVIYFPGANTLNLVNDDGSALVSSSNVQLGSATVLSNSRCSIDPALAVRSAIARGVEVTLPMTFTNSFLGMKNLYAIGFDNTGLVTHWVQGGVFAVQ